MESKWVKVPCNVWYSSNHVALLSWCYICCSLPAFIFVISSLGVLSGEREEVHAASRQPEAERCGEGLHVQQTRLCHLQHRTEVCIFWGYAYLFCNLWWTLKDVGHVFAAPDPNPNPYSSSQHQMPYVIWCRGTLKGQYIWIFVDNVQKSSEIINKMQINNNFDRYLLRLAC